MLSHYHSTQKTGAIAPCIAVNENAPSVVHNSRKLNGYKLEHHPVERLQFIIRDGVLNIKQATRIGQVRVHSTHQVNHCPHPKAIKLRQLYFLWQMAHVATLVESRNDFVCLHGGHCEYTRVRAEYGRAPRAAQTSHSTLPDIPAETVPAAL